MGHSTSSGRQTANRVETARAEVARDGMLRRQLARAIDRTAFENRGGGEWEIDIDGVGGGQILDETGSTRDPYYGRGGRVYSVRIWDADYSQQGEEMVNGSLSEAKRRLREMLHSVYGTRG